MRACVRALAPCLLAAASVRKAGCVAPHAFDISMQTPEAEFWFLLLLFIYFQTRATLHRRAADFAPDAHVCLFPNLLFTIIQLERNVNSSLMRSLRRFFCSNALRRSRWRSVGARKTDLPQRVHRSSARPQDLTLDWSSFTSHQPLTSVSISADREDSEAKLPVWSSLPAQFFYSSDNGAVQLFNKF